eukprot:CAMPEP_0197394892 /NCGR_PEP_ID=MMETSP1165-20131217/6225_1 /TAXON_ID=284809 /ORGANISM="Chrysocystis fragilis, Strain CCMP3189" /LENGTH=160 /DNA_ID=CAMNT_0042920631 /DNA_START=27 /DNA_END=508 /DNA_ORIENTATION=-
MRLITLLTLLLSLAHALRPQTTTTTRRCFSSLLVPATLSVAIVDSAAAREPAGQAMDPAMAKKYKAIYSAKEKMPKESQAGYMKKVCDTGILGALDPRFAPLLALIDVQSDRQVPPSRGGQRLRDCGADARHRELRGASERAFSRPTAVPRQLSSFVVCR